MSLQHLIAGAIVGGVLGAAALGLVAHIVRLALTNPRELAELSRMLWEVVYP